MALGTVFEPDMKCKKSASPSAQLGRSLRKGKKELSWARQEWIHLFKNLLHRSFLGLQTLDMKSIMSDKLFLRMRSSLSHSRTTASLSFSCCRGKTYKQRIFVRLKTVIFSLQATGCYLWVEIKAA